MDEFDLIAIGRVSMDLFSQNIGAPFEEIEGFATSVGGTPTNVAIGASRLGLKVALLTAVGPDTVGNFVRRTLSNEGVETGYIPVKPGTQTGLAILGIEPPDKFPLTFYRQNPADIHLSIDDVQALPLAQCRALFLSGTALSRGTCRDATFFAAAQAQKLGIVTFLDLDLRPDQWSHPRAYGVNIRLLLPYVDVVIGTEEEYWAALMDEPENLMRGEKISQQQQETLSAYLPTCLQEAAAPATFVLKRGAAGSTIYTRGEAVIQVQGIPVNVLNTVGAGDAFASGLIYGRLRGLDWRESATIANASGAIVVTRHGCAAAMPYEKEVLDFIHTGVHMGGSAPR